MKILVATSRTQGDRTTDYHHCVDGELVWIQEPCARDRYRRKPVCGCGFGFAGLSSHRGTSTAMIVDAEMTRDDYIIALRSSFAEGGWPVELAEVIGRDQLEFAERFDVGAVIERDLDEFAERPV